MSSPDSAQSGWMGSRYQLGQMKKTFSHIFRLKSYFLCSLNYILAWNYVFSVTQIDVCFCYLCQAECRENSVLQEVVGFTVREKEEPLPHTQLPEGPCRGMHPSSAPRQGWEPCSCHPMSLFMYALSADAANNILPFDSYTCNAAHTGMQ